MDAMDIIDKYCKSRGGISRNQAFKELGDYSHIIDEKEKLKILISNRKDKLKMIDDIKNVTLLCNVETRIKQIHVTLFNQDYFNCELTYFDDHDITYKVSNEDFYENFKKIRKIKGDYNNTYKPIKFKTERECLIYLKSIGIDEINKFN